MFRFWQFLSFTLTIVVCRCNDDNNFIEGITKMFKNMSVHTVWSATCWGSSINGKLLKRLSDEDISIIFDPQKMTVVNQTHNTWYKSGVLVDLACNQASNVLHQASNERLFNLQNYWILFNQNRNPNETNSADIALQTFKKYMGQNYVLPDSRVYLLIKINDNNWEMWDGFRLNVFEEVRVSRVGLMTSDRIEIQHSDRTNFENIVLQASTVILEPNSFHGWNDTSYLGNNLDLFAHMHYAIVRILAEQLNFTLNLTFSTDYGWSYGNGTFSGLIGQLQREEIDFTAAGGLMRTDRMDIGDLTVSTFVARTIVIFKQPPLSSVKNIFLLPFTPGVWIVMLIMILTYTLTLIFLIWMSNILNGQKTHFSSSLDTITMVLGAICQQGMSIAVHSIPIRLATFVLFLSAVFLFTSYAASIVALLQSTSQAINDVKDLAEQPITFSAQDTRHNYIYLNETNDDNVKKIYFEKMKPYGKKAFTSPEIGMERVRNKFHSFLVEITLAYHIISNTWQEHEKCTLSEIELFKIPLLTLYVVKKSGYRDLFKQKMLQQHEIGLYRRISKRSTPQRQKCDSASVINFDSISMKDIHSALLFLGSGVCVSLLLFFFEHAIHKVHVFKQKMYSI